MTVVPILLKGEGIDTLSNIISEFDAAYGCIGNGIDRCGWPIWCGDTGDTECDKWHYSYENEEDLLLSRGLFARRPPTCMSVAILKKEKN